MQKQLNYTDRTKILVNVENIDFILFLLRMNAIGSMPQRDGYVSCE